VELATTLHRVQPVPHYSVCDIRPDNYIMKIQPRIQIQPAGAPHNP
jgi:hypothetical protein